MSPGSSYKNDQFDNDDNNLDLEYRRTTTPEEAPEVPRPTNMPARSSRRHRTSRGKSKNPATKTGIQRRRNKRFGF